MGSKGVRERVLGTVMAAALCCCLLTSCGQTDDGLSPLDPQPPASLSDLFGNVLFDADGNEVGIEAVEDKAIIAIYFEAQWCPSCEAFVPRLLSFYEELRQAGKSFEIVLVSFDDSAEKMFAHMKAYAMPWLAVPFRGDKAEALTERYNVRGIPTLIVIDGEGKTITVNGRSAVVEKGASAYDDWLAGSGGQ